MAPDLEIRHYDHYEENFVLLSLPESSGEEILRDADAYYLDTRTGRFIAVKRMYVLGADRDVAVPYEIKDGITWLVTIFPLKERQQQNRRDTGRWQPYEPEG